MPSDTRSKHKKKKTASGQLGAVSRVHLDLSSYYAMEPEEYGAHSFEKDPFTSPRSGDLELSGLKSKMQFHSLSLAMESIDYNRDHVLNCIKDDELMPPPDATFISGQESNLTVTDEDLMPPPDSTFIDNHYLHDEITSLSSYSPLSSPEVLSPRSLVTSPEPFLSDSNTQMSLIENAADLHLDSTSLHTLESESSNWLYPSNSESQFHEEAPRKSTRLSDSDGGPHSPENSIDPSNSNTLGYDLSGAISASQFIFTKFGSGVMNASKQGTILNMAAPEINHVAKSMASPYDALLEKEMCLPLSSMFPCKRAGIELKITKNLEIQHRARYMTEGSRGAVKDRSGEDHPSIKLIGYNQKATLQIFVGTDSGRVRPHGFYQACRVCSKNSTLCEERTVNGTSVIEIEFDPDKNMEICLDCVGILKLRNADVEQRIGPVKSKKKSTKARLVFRVALKMADNVVMTLQVASTPILCTQPIGQPEICKQSLDQATADGGQELYFIGKNFMKGTKVLFQQRDGDSNKLTWEKEAEIISEFFQSSHMIAVVPKYSDESFTVPVNVEIIVQCGTQLSDAKPFLYVPVSSNPAVEQPTQQQQQPSYAESPPVSVKRKFSSSNGETNHSLESKPMIDEVHHDDATMEDIQMVTQNSDGCVIPDSMPVKMDQWSSTDKDDSASVTAEVTASADNQSGSSFSCSVSPVALELNKLLQEMHRSSSTSIFQLPAGIGLPSSLTKENPIVKTTETVNYLPIDSAEHGDIGGNSDVSLMDVSPPCLSRVTQEMAVPVYTQQLLAENQISPNIFENNASGIVNSGLVILHENNGLSATLQTKSVAMDPEVACENTSNGHVSLSERSPMLASLLTLPENMIVKQRHNSCPNTISSTTAPVLPTISVQDVDEILLTTGS